MSILLPVTLFLLPCNSIRVEHWSIARAIAIRDALSTFFRSISLADAAPNPKITPFFFNLSNISDRFFGDSFFESFNLLIKWLEIGLKLVSTKVEATANTGPANDPRPTSSTPIEILFII